MAQHLQRSSPKVRVKVARSPIVLSLMLVCALPACDQIGSLQLPSDAGMGDGGTRRDAGTSCQKRGALRINEVLTDNDGVWVDTFGETDDFIELFNTGLLPLKLDDYLLADDSHDPVRLPGELVMPGQSVLLWADDEVEQGRRHLPFKLDADGDAVQLRHIDCGAVDSVDVPALPLNESYARLPDGSGAFVRCRYATPRRSNGAACEPPPPPSLPNDQTFAPYAWPAAVPAVPSPLALTELALKPAAFVEVLNTSDQIVNLDDYRLRVAAMAPGMAWPLADQGTSLAWPSAMLLPGARVSVPVTAADVSALDASPEFEGAVSLFDGAAQAIDRADFMHWPQGAALTRTPETSGQFRFCNHATPALPNDRCDGVTLRPTGDRIHALHTDGDFRTLAAGGTEVGLEGLKFVVDMQSGDVVHLIGSERWALHYTFIREQIDRQPALDRCDPVQAREFEQGWVAFSQINYFRSEGRRFLLGTLVRHASGLHTVEFATGDAITPEQMRRAFFAAVARTEDPKQWFLRPADSSQLRRMREIEGTVPIVGTNAPYIDLHYQPLTQVVGYGELMFVRSDQLDSAELGPHTLVITDGVPNDLPFVGGLITEAFQTPLAHINVLSRARGTPNMALRDARNHPRLKPYLSKLVRLEVAPSDFVVREASAEEADAFWQAHKPSGPAIEPPIDATVRGVQPLSERGLADLPAIGGKAAQFAELYKVNLVHLSCAPASVPLNVPEQAFAIPVAHYLEHFRNSGAQALLESLRADATFRADSKLRAQGLANVRSKMLAWPVDVALLQSVEAAVRDSFGEARLRMRSSSNTEDLPTFNGAGLHTSASAQLGDEKLQIADAMRTVWSSLWNQRAFDEREFANIDQSRAAMAILVHAAGQGEAAQGVAISRNMLHVTRSDMYTINAQIGEASVTNPAPGVVTEQLLYTWPGRSPEVSAQTRSSLTEGQDVLMLEDIRNVACAVGAVHDHFRPLLDPLGLNRLFAMQIEFKVERDTRRLIVKQARPQPIVGVEVPADCREF